MKIKHRRFIYVIQFLMILITVIPFTIQAATQKLELRAGWNLISLAVEPANGAITSIFQPLIENNIFESIWTYDSIDETWMTHPAPVTGIPAFENVEVGKGYWVKVTSSTELAIEGADTVASGDLQFDSGWNLVGFALQEAKDYRYLLSGISINQIWTYDPDASQFMGIEFAAGTDTVVREDFTMIEPGKAYWIYAGEAVTSGPVLSTSMEADKDFAPFLPEGVPGERVEWTEVTLGDEDIGEDGYFDSPVTQRALTFRDTLEVQRIYVSNSGSGILNFQASVQNPQAAEWLKLESWDEENEEFVDATGTAGSVSTNTAIIKLKADRTGLSPGDYYADLVLASNGRPDQEPLRTISIHLNVATIEGDYKLVAHIDTVNGRKADMHNPRYYLSLYKDNNDPEDSQLKGIIDEDRSLLMPKRFYLTGQYYEVNSNRFTVSGGIVLPANDPSMDLKDPKAGLNPYQVDLRRDITLIGDRKTLNDANLGALDLKGEYRETIRNVLSEPIYLAGTFVAYRLNKKASKLDKSEKYITGESIPDGINELQKTITIEEKDNVRITEVDITPQIEHTRPSDLIVTLTSPANTTVILRQNSNDIVGRITYDEDTLPLESLDAFIGETSAGDWIVTVQDVIEEESGGLVDCSLSIKGTKIYYISGTIPNLPEGATILLSGCGVTQTTQVDQNGFFQFNDLVNCTYTVTVIEPGFEQVSLEVTIDGEHVDDLELPVDKAIATSNDYLLGPLTGNAPLMLSMTDVSPLNPSDDYRYDWYIRKVDTGSGFTMLDNHVSSTKYLIENPGIYVTKLEIHNLTKPTEPTIIIEKPDQYILVGQPSNGSYKMPFFTTTGSGGMPKGAGGTTPKEQENAFDSATFDIDRQPIDANNPGPEDSNRFLGESDLPDPVTGTNKIGNNAVLDGPIGESSKRIYVNIGLGQPFIGQSVSGNLKIHIGPNP